MSRMAGHHPVRYREDTGWEYRCALCAEWWPLDLTHWRPKSGMARCAACWRAYFAAKERGRSAVEAVAEAKREANRVRYAANRQARLAANRAWREANRERIAAYNRAYRERNRAELATYARAYYAEAQDVILAKKRAAYHGEAVA